MIDLKQMEAELAELQAKYNEAKLQVKLETIEAIKSMLASGTLEPDDLKALLPKTGPDRPHRTRKVKPPKYRDPVTGSTWTGQGATPNWLKDKDLNDFLIKNAA